ncbi:histidine phosphotransferase family protein [uncultured Roseobacter sp.]|uniref:histidine phosphotransferase family protein n=1 Tax=uncultured Roseobacter sp. TaxID=114847 RepID=UPI0026256E4A|nr:histidine phosphotransferase family protein [uncultured Roseobacter sp.]
MGQSNINLAALIGSRICHDLISPIGAINNGLELLGMAGGTPGPEIDLIQESVGNASARIRFFRIAFGASGDQMMGRAEVVSILDDLMDGGRLAVAWGPLDPQPRGDVRMVFLALQCLENAMPYGGRIEVSREDNMWLLHGEADKLNIDEPLWNILATRDAPPSLRPAQVQFALLPILADDGGRRVVTEMSETQIKLRF